MYNQKPKRVGTLEKGKDKKHQKKTNAMICKSRKSIFYLQSDVENISNAESEHLLFHVKY